MATTPRQRAAVHFCEEWLYNVTFTGDINNFKQVSNFLSMYLDKAKEIASEAEAEYNSWLWDKDY